VHVLAVGDLVGFIPFQPAQVTKDTATYSLKNTVRRSKLFDNLDPGWKSVIVAHYGAITMPEYLASLAEARMGRFGRAAAWRNTATFGALDEVRHGQIQAFFPYGLIDKEPRGDWALKAFHTNDWIVLAVRYLFDDMFVANDAASIALQLTFTLETGFTNLQFLSMAADAIDVGDLEFGALISSIQTDEARHAQQGEPTVKVFIDNGQKEWSQFLIDHMFWRSWRVFALLTGPVDGLLHTAGKPADVVQGVHRGLGGQAIRRPVPRFRSGLSLVLG
jgi:toluene monooxygenase system protein A